jgi:Pyruvate/2-oxoacid:ferredoxin oxidoreductase delta subunit
MSKTADSIGVVLACGGLFSSKERESIAARLGSALLIEEAFGAPAQVPALASRIAKRRFRRVLLAGVAPAGQAELLQALARQANLPAAAVAGVDLAPALAASGRTSRGGTSRGGASRGGTSRGGASRSRAAAAAAIKAIQRGLAGLAEIPTVERRRLDLEPGVLVVGAGPAGREAAAALCGLGHPVTIVEKTDGSARAAGTAGTVALGAELLSDSTVRRVEGQVGRFAVTVRSPSGDRKVTCGAVVLATGIPAPGEGAAAAPAAPFDTAGVVPLERLEQAVAGLPRRRGVRPVAVILDWRLEETKGSTQAALELSLRLQKEGALQVHLLCREARVAAMELEELYDRARQAGVDIIKFEGRPSLRGAAKAVCIDFRDAILGQEVSLECDAAGVSGYGVQGGADAELARMFGVSLDALGQFQLNNIHLFPGETNRPGVFAAGACRGQFYLPLIRSEARAAALAAHQLLAPGVLELELAQPVVDEDKCALCLTCVRSCPHGAMYVDREKGVAACAPEACRRCGICAGECPAKAITLPAWSDRAVLSQVS